MKLISRWIVAITLAANLGSAFAEEEIKQEASKHYEQALEAFTGEKLSETFIHLKNALQINPEHLSSKLLLAKVFFNDGNMYAAEKEFEECLALGSDINLILPLYGSTLILQQKPDKLLSLKKYSSTFTPQTQFEWQLLKGQAYLQKNNSAMARQTLEKAAAMFPSDTRAINTLASYYMGLEQVEQAHNMINRSLAINDQNEKTWQLRGEIAAKENNLDAALKFFSKAYEIDDTDPRILRSMAKTHLQRQEMTQAKYYLELILEQSPNDPSASLLHAVVVLSEGSKELGQQMLADLSDKLTMLDESQQEDNNATLFIKATTEYIQGNNEKAKTLLGSYLGNNPGDLAAIRMLVDLHLKQSNNHQVVQLLQDQQKYTGNDFGLILQLAHLYIGEGKHFTAREQLKRLRVLAPNHPYILMLEAQLLSAENKPEEALSLLKSYEFGEVEPLDYALQRGSLEISTGNLQQALSSVKQLLEKYPDNPAVLNFATAAHLKSNQLDSAKGYIERVLKVKPDDLTARFNHTLSLKIEGNRELAVSAAKEILIDRPEHIPAILLISRIRLEESKHAEALDWVKKINAYDKENISANELKLAIYTQTEDWENAIKTTRLLHKISPETPEYLIQQALLLTETGQQEKAQRPLYLLFSQWSNNPQQLQRLAQLQVTSGNLKGARKSLETALKLDKDSFNIQLALARLTALEGNQTDIQKAITQLQQQFGSHTQIEMMEGDLANQASELAIARQHYTKAFKLDNNNGQALIKLYQLTLSREGEKEFTQLIEEHREKNQAPAWVIRLLADSYLNQGKNKLAQTRYETLLEDPALKNDAEILNNLANIYSINNLDQALNTATRGLSSGKKYAPLLDTIGWILIQQEKYSEGLSYLRDSFALNSLNTETRYHLGVALMKLDRNSEALNEFNTVLLSSASLPNRQEIETNIEILKAKIAKDIQASNVE